MDSAQNRHSCKNEIFTKDLFKGDIPGDIGKSQPKDRDVNYIFSECTYPNPTLASGHGQVSNRLIFLHRRISMSLSDFTVFTEKFGYSILLEFFCCCRNSGYPVFGIFSGGQASLTGVLILSGLDKPDNSQLFIPKIGI